MSEKLVGADGKPALGIFADAVDRINAGDCDLRTPMNKKASAYARYFGYKRFQYFGVISEQLIFGCALVDLRYLCMAFIYLYRPSDGAMRQWRIKTPLALGMTLSDSPVRGHSAFSFGAMKIAMEYDDTVAEFSHCKRLRVDIGSELGIDAELCEPPSYPRLALCTPIAGNGWVYAQKTAGVAVRGRLQSELGNFDLQHIGAFGHHDFSAGYMRRDTFWNWACLSGVTKAGQRLGLNVSWGVNESGWSENCLWLDDVRHALPQVQFQFDRDDEKSLWRITSSDGEVALRFEPAGCFREDIDAWVLASRFRQFFGSFSGRLMTAGGHCIVVENMRGFVEDQYSRW
jgi:hypothetical protein